MKNIVLQAIEATLSNPDGQDWLDRVYLMASKEGGTGKYLPMTPEEVKEVVENANWEIETFRDGYRPTFVALAKGIDGFFDLMRLEDLADDEELIVSRFGGDKPLIGWVSDSFTGSPTDELRAICSADDKGELGRFLVRVFPGLIVDKEAMEIPEKYLGRRISVAEAKNLGASFCKVVTTTAAEALKSVY